MSDLNGKSNTGGPMPCQFIDGSLLMSQDNCGKYLPKVNVNLCFVVWGTVGIMVGGVHANTKGMAFICTWLLISVLQMLRIIHMNGIVVLNGKICSCVRAIPFLSQQKIDRCEANSLCHRNLCLSCSNMSSCVYVATSPSTKSIEIKLFRFVGRNSIVISLSFSARRIVLTNALWLGGPVSEGGTAPVLEILRLSSHIWRYDLPSFKTGCIRPSILSFLSWLMVFGMMFEPSSLCSSLAWDTNTSSRFRPNLRHMSM